MYRKGSIESKKIFIASRQQTKYLVILLFAKELLSLEGGRDATIRCCNTVYTKTWVTLVSNVDTYLRSVLLGIDNLDI